MAKAEQMSDAGCTSVRADLRKNEKCWAAAQRKECKNVRETALQIPRTIKTE